MAIISLDRIASFVTRTANSLNVFQAISRRRARIRFEEDLKSIAPLKGSLVSQPILLDGTWDNPNYWLRVQLLLSALGIQKGQVQGLLGSYNVQQQTATMRRMGILGFHYLSDSNGEKISAKAEALWENLGNASEILEWELPHELPPALLYDHILKRQRLETVCIHDTNGALYVSEFLEAAKTADKMFASSPISLFIASHAVGATSVWVWVALKYGVKVIVPFGYAGLCRYWSLHKPTDIFEFGDRMARNDMELLPATQQIALEQCGEQEVARRIEGITNNIGASYAFRKNSLEVNKQEICEQFGWEISTPIVAFYSSNWFDYPHSFGMNRFLDHWDLIQAVVEAAKLQKKVNWLIKGHPCDAWYGSVDFRKRMADAETAHIKITQQLWGGAGLLKAIDAFVTCHGTVGVEAAALGKPVLVAERGWYDQAGFVRTSDSREDFLELLVSQWWTEIPLAKTTRKARQFAGLYWGRPDWQAGFLLEDDSRQWEIYQDGKQLIRGNMDVIERELECIRAWFQSGHSHYHVFKMLKTEDYAVN